jgi:hypothetical protein
MCPTERLNVLQLLHHPFIKDDSPLDYNVKKNTFEFEKKVNDSITIKSLSSLQDDSLIKVELEILEDYKDEKDLKDEHIDNKTNKIVARDFGFKNIQKF